MEEKTPDKTSLGEAPTQQATPQKLTLEKKDHGRWSSWSIKASKGSDDDLDWEFEAAFPLMREVSKDEYDVLLARFGIETDDFAAASKYLLDDIAPKDDDDKAIDIDSDEELGFGSEKQVALLKSRAPEF